MHSDIEDKVTVYAAESPIQLIEEEGGGEDFARAAIERNRRMMT